MPKNEVSHLFSARSKCNEVSEGTWARVKNGKYKGDLAQVRSQLDIAVHQLLLIFISFLFFKFFLPVDCSCEQCTEKSNSEAYSKN